jgi:Ca2+-binding EF-hand superfamily protein
LGTSIKTNNAMTGLTTSLLDSDPTLRGYLPSATLMAIFRKNGVRDLNDQQFATVFTAIDKNSQGDSSFKQLLELILGAEETQRLFAGAAMGVRP